MTLPALALAALALGAPGLADLGATLRVVPERHPSRGEPPFRLAEPRTSLAEDRLRGELDLRGRATGLGPGDLRLVATARETWAARSRPATRLLLDELHWDGVVLGQRVSAGKKVLAWDVGHAFRPLDVLQREDRRALAQGALEGIPSLGWERFGDDTAWLVVWANPLRGEARLPRDDESIAARHYRRLGAADLHLVARLSRRNQAEAGAAVVHVAREDLEWHGSVLWQRRHERLVHGLAEAGSSGPPLAAGDPVAARAGRDGVRALLGATLSFEGGLSLLAEAWHDPAGSTAAEWRRVADLGRRQVALLGVAPGHAVEGNVAWSARLFARPSLLRDNVLVRLSRAAPAGEGLEPSLDVLVTPEDRGFVATLAVAWRGARHRLELGLRAFGGPPGAAYRLLPEPLVGFGVAEVAF